MTYSVKSSQPTHLPGWFWPVSSSLAILIVLTVAVGLTALRHLAQ
jgi:hypothetical protein